MRLFDFSRSISKLVKDKNYGDALKYFKENKGNFTDDEIRGNEYVVSSMITALRHQPKLDNAFKFINKYKIEINTGAPEKVANSYGWLLFAKFKADNAATNSLTDEAEDFTEENTIFNEEEIPSKSDTLEKIEAILPILINFNQDFNYMLITQLFKVVLKAEKLKPNPNWKFISEMCDLINPDMLKTDCETIQVERKGVLKDMEMASDRESWYAYKSKALQKMGEFEECARLSKQALANFTVFHYSNDIWFANRIALAKRHLGDIDGAIADLQIILKKKKEWFLQKELAALYFEKNDLDNSLSFALKAINNFGPLEFKIDLLFLLGTLYLHKKEEALAFKHYTLSKLVRLKEEWTVPPKLASALLNFNFPEIPMGKMPELRRELNIHWDTFKEKPTKYINPTGGYGVSSGSIQKIMHSDEKGTDGFIKGADGKRYYFKINASDEMVAKIKVGLNVSFNIQPSTKDGQNDKAIKLHLS